ncbi:MAG: ABC transporter permease [Lachnospiraceae bacterium]|nr:ABC transporter permease [Lachnospiraceae bacterium]
MKKTIWHKFSYFYVAVLTVLTYVPILLTVIYSFNESKLTTKWTGFSWKWYLELFRDRDMWEALRNSLVLAGLSCLGAVIIGTTGALGMHGRKSKADQAISGLSLLPIMIPEIILGMVFLAVFSFMNLPFGMLTLVLAHTTFCVPYVFSMVKARLVGMDKAFAEAALDLGATPIRVFFDITLPLIMPAILSGVMLSFAMSFDDVVISIFVTGPTVNTLPIKIYTKMKTGVTPEINALATIMLMITAILLIGAAFINKIGVKREVKKGGTK